jgi:hypothetical protein
MKIGVERKKERTKEKKKKRKKKREGERERNMCTIWAVVDFLHILTLAEERCVGDWRT